MAINFNFSSSYNEPLIKTVMDNSYVEKLECVHILKSHPTGSRYICDPPPKNTGEDYVCLITPETREITELWMLNQGWEFCGQYTGAEFVSYRNGEYNLVITWLPDYYDCFVEATEGAKEKNILNKRERCNFFEEVFNKRNHPRHGNIDAQQREPF